MKTRATSFLAAALIALFALPLPAADAPGIVFQDATAPAGIRFKHTSGAAGKKFLPETMGSGCAFLDFDNDGDQDVLLVNSMEWTPGKGGKALPALYRNDGRGGFTDVTKEAGLAFEAYGMGVAAADYDNDGWVDLFLTALGRNRLFKNRGGTFADVTDKAGVAGGGFSASALFFDYDKDGRLDLFVTRYVEWSAEKDLFCTLDGKNKSYCTPESYKGASPILYRNRGDGAFEDATVKAGVQSPTAKALGVAMLDFDGDTWPDLIVANDTQPNRLYRNNRNGTFTDVGMTAGVAFSEAGVARAGMGVDAADYDASGRPGIVIGNFSNEMMGLYHNEGSGLFVDDAPGSPVGQATALTLTFACFFFDYDLDGLLDIFAANGHVADDINRAQAKVQYAQPPHVFRNLGSRKFEVATPRLGAALQRPMVARGAAYGDVDGDGDLDVLVNVNNGSAVLFRNDGGNKNHYLRVRTVGTTSNRDGIGARVTVTPEGGRPLQGTVKSGSSYLSQSELPLTFGLGGATKVAKVEVAWPSGKTDQATGVAADRTIIIKEGSGLTPGPAAPPVGPGRD